MVSGDTSAARQLFCGLQLVLELLCKCACLRFGGHHVVYEVPVVCR